MFRVVGSIMGAIVPLVMGRSGHYENFILLAIDYMQSSSTKTLFFENFVISKKVSTVDELTITRIQHSI